MITRRRRARPGAIALVGGAMPLVSDLSTRDAEPCMCGALDCRACRGAAAEVAEEDETETEPDDDRREEW